MGELLHDSKPEGFFGSERAELKLWSANFRSGSADLRPERGDFRLEKTYSKLERLNFRPQ